MPRITKVYTRTGDDGTTGLGGGQRVAKDSLRIEAYGTVDELNSQIGVALAAGVNDGDRRRRLRAIQNELFHLGSDLCILEEDKAKMPGPANRGAARRRAREAHGPALGGAAAAGELHPSRRRRPAPRSCTSRARSAAAPSGSSSRCRAQEDVGPGPCAT